MRVHASRLTGIAIVSKVLLKLRCFWRTRQGGKKGNLHNPKNPTSWEVQTLCLVSWLHFCLGRCFLVVFSCVKKKWPFATFTEMWKHNNLHVFGDARGVAPIYQPKKHMTPGFWWGSLLDRILQTGWTRALPRKKMVDDDGWMVEIHWEI